MEKLGQITFLGDRKVSMVEMDFDVDDKTLDLIAAHAIHLIENDKPALFRYAMTRHWRILRKEKTHGRSRN